MMKIVLYLDMIHVWVIFFAYFSDNMMLVKWVCVDDLPAFPYVSICHRCFFFFTFFPKSSYFCILINSGKLPLISLTTHDI
jgi:hypothetical protein